MACEAEAATVVSIASNVAGMVADAAILSAQLMQKQMDIAAGMAQLSAAQMSLTQCQMNNPGN